MWTITSTRISADDGEIYETFGIRINDTVINDISVNKKEIEDFIIRLNEMGASEIHAYDLVEDFLGK